MQITLEIKCPTCLSDGVKKNGLKLYGKQNYQCKNCKRQFIGDHALSYRGCHSGINCSVPMKEPKYTPEEFKIEAVKQVTEKGHSVAEVAARLGTTTHSLYTWIKRYDPQQPRTTEFNDPSSELAKLKKELQRVTEERDILKKAAVYFASQSK